MGLLGLLESVGLDGILLVALFSDGRVLDLAGGAVRCGLPNWQKAGPQLLRNMPEMLQGLQSKGPQFLITTPKVL